MRREDIVLRDAARRGEPRACVEMAARLFAGDAGFARNFKLGLAYVQQELERRSPAAVVLVAEQVPLQILIEHKARAIVAAAADRGSRVAQRKLRVWQALRAATDPRELLGMLHDDVTREPHEVLLAAAREALADEDLAGARCCIHAIAPIASCPADSRVVDVVWSAVQLAMRTRETLALPVELVEQSLASRSEQGEAEAQFGLGRASAGMRYGDLVPQELVQRKNVRRAAALLLRAADAGKAEAWLSLYEIASDGRTGAGNQEAARFYLEKAAGCGLVSAQRTLGALLLKEATSLEAAERGVHWLSRAAEGADGAARELLQTLLLPLPALSDTIEKTIVEKVRAVDAELAARLTLARAFHLTRREALNFARRDIRAWGLLIPGTSKENPKGRLAPAVHEPMKIELQRAASFFGAGATLDNAFVLQKGRMQKRIFEALAIPEDMFFAPGIGRSWSHYGFGRHWAARAAPLLKEHLAS